MGLPFALAGGRARFVSFRGEGAASGLSSKLGKKIWEPHTHRRGAAEAASTQTLPSDWKEMQFDA